MLSAGPLQAKLQNPEYMCTALTGHLFTILAASSSRCPYRHNISFTLLGSYPQASAYVCLATIENLVKRRCATTMRYAIFAGILYRACVSPSRRWHQFN